jgi:pimeloyl-ACP methyl ester carboxylesterase
VTILLLPGMDGTSVFFEPFVSQCQPGVEVRTFDYEALQLHSYEAIVEHIAASLPDDDFLVLGWSFSGAVALMLAARQIPRLRGVILVATFAERPIRRLPGFLSGLVHPALMSLYPLASKLQALVQGYSSREFRALQSRAFSRTTARSVAARVRLLMTVDVRAQVRSCPVPILYLQGRYDRVIDRSHGERIVAAAPRATLVELPGPHLCLATHPREGWRAVDAFIAAV